MCISLVSNAIVHLLLCSFAVHVSSLVVPWLESSAHFWAVGPTGFLSSDLRRNNTQSFPLEYDVSCRFAIDTALSVEDIVVFLVC